MITTMNGRRIGLGVALVAILAASGVAYPLARAADPCDEAREHLLGLLEASPGEMDVDLAAGVAETAALCAERLGDAVANADRVPKLPTTELDRPQTRLPARECSGGDHPPFEVPLALIVGIYQVATPAWNTHEVETDNGSIVAVYHKSTDTTVFTATSERWGLHLVSSPEGPFVPGEITYRGVPIPVLPFVGSASAAVGCSAEDPTVLCWATASARVYLTAFAFIDVTTDYDNCGGGP